MPFLGVPWESLSVLGRSLGVLVRHCVHLEVSLGSPGAPENVENEIGSSSGASVVGNTTKRQWFFNDFQNLQKLSKVVLWSLWGCLGMSSGSWVSLESAAGRPWRLHGSPWGPLGYFWESLRVPWGHLGSARGALAVLKIIEKTFVFIVFPTMADPWATLERLWFLLWGP